MSIKMKLQQERYPVLERFHYDDRRDSGEFSDIDLYAVIEGRAHPKEEKTKLPPRPDEKRSRNIKAFGNDLHRLLSNRRLSNNSEKGIKSLGETRQSNHSKKSNRSSQGHSDHLNKPTMKPMIKLGMSPPLKQRLVQGTMPVPSVVYICTKQDIEKMERMNKNQQAKNNRIRGRKSIPPMEDEMKNDDDLVLNDDEHDMLNHVNDLFNIGRR